MITMHANGNYSPLRLALPSKGVLEKSTTSLLSACGMGVFRPSDRQYVGSIPSVPQITDLLQRFGNSPCRSPFPNILKKPNELRSCTSGNNLPVVLTTV
ncbi:MULTISPECIES: hypothetical protein [unclassified Coleofasciculus]|uniref:hypothetical protein n=1 Tax=unclassified Coleofasciculus TaxID=2692782 RepID=UPI001882DB09|nr:MULTISPECIES: hypothetical protein [unclassified Coleofasciculus]MBE9128385.1 hypothetical protein [Coleofasciculus sp. LEGE 07081]MBE9147905.1 hypothetical protein [Coleofasciculus sp. LEGE 07092]